MAQNNCYGIHLLSSVSTSWLCGEKERNLCTLTFSISDKKVSSSSLSILFGWVILVWTPVEDHTETRIERKLFSWEMIQETPAGCREKRQWREGSQWRGHGQASHYCKQLLLIPSGSSRNQCGTLTSEIPPRELGFFPPTVISDWLREIMPFKFQAHLAVREPSGKTPVVLTEVRPGCTEMVACVLQSQFLSFLVACSFTFLLSQVLPLLLLVLLNHRVPFSRIV